MARRRSATASADRPARSSTDARIVRSRTSRGSAASGASSARSASTWRPARDSASASATRAETNSSPASARTAASASADSDQRRNSWRASPSVKRSRGSGPASLMPARAAASASAHVRGVFQWLEGRQGAEALAAARAGIKDAGPDPRLRFTEGLALQELRRWSESAEALAAVRADAGELFVSARVALADALSRAGRHVEAERALDAPLAAEPRDVRLLTMRASVLDRAGRSADSVALLRRAIAERERAKVETDLPDLYVALADSLSRSARPEEAIAALKGALATRPREEELLFALGAAYERAGQPEVAVAQMRALLAVNPDHTEALNFIGYAYAEQGVRLEDAERMVRRALELRPRSGHILD